MTLTAWKRTDPARATPEVLRRRGLRAWTIGPWVIVYAPRKHPLRSL